MKKLIKIVIPLIILVSLGLAGWVLFVKKNGGDALINSQKNAITLAPKTIKSKLVLEKEFSTSFIMTNIKGGLVYEIGIKLPLNQFRTSFQEDRPFKFAGNYHLLISCKDRVLVDKNINKPKALMYQSGGVEFYDELVLTTFMSPTSYEKSECKGKLTVIEEDKVLSKVSVDIFYALSGVK